MFRQLLRFMNQKTFFQKVQLCHTQPHIGFLATCQNLIKHMTKKKKGEGRTYHILQDPSCYHRGSNVASYNSDITEFLDITEFYKNNIDQLCEQVKHLHGI